MTVGSRGAVSCPLAKLLASYMRLSLNAVGDVPFDHRSDAGFCSVSRRTIAKTGVSS
jgi:hypothetical protein